MEMQVKRFSPEADQYKGEWIALTPDDEERIVGHGKTPQDAIDQAARAGYRVPVLLFIPVQWPKVLVV